VVLGIGQDAGAPQIGNLDDPAWAAPELGLLATSLGVVDHERREHYLFEASPDITAQLAALNRIAAQRAGSKTKSGLGLDGVFLTHAHIGHYAGLIYLGREAAGAKGVPVYAMPRLAEFLETNGPWEQLVTLGNIALTRLADREALRLNEALMVTPYQVPHRDEYSETVGYIIEGPTKRALFVPDIDSWQEWEDTFGTRIEDMIARVDIAYLDATFFDDDELPGRDMSLIPHPRIAASMDRFDSLPEEERAKVSFIHLNHTNLARDPASGHSGRVARRGYEIARRGDRFCLSD
jgi:pyrroloquinoline quinone biosynthesis protein B